MWRSRRHHLLPSPAAGLLPLLLLLLTVSLAPSVTCLASPSRLTRAASQPINGDQPATFTLASPAGEGEAVELRLFGSRLADVSAVSVELRQHGSSDSSHRRLEPVPSRGGGSLSELRWSLCGADGVDTLLVSVHWGGESGSDGRPVHCQVGLRSVLLTDGGDWEVRLGSVEFRRLSWPPGSAEEGEEDGPASVMIRSSEATAATACLKRQCVDDVQIDSLSPDDDVTCQEFTDCATFDIEQGRPSLLYVRPRGAASHQIGKQLQVRFAAGRPPPDWTAAAPAPPPPPPGSSAAAAECRHLRLGRPARGQEDGGTKGTPLKVRVKTTVTVYRPTPQQESKTTGEMKTTGERETTGEVKTTGEMMPTEQTKTTGQRESDVRGADAGDVASSAGVGASSAGGEAPSVKSGASSGGSGQSPWSAARLLAAAAAVTLLLSRA